MTKLHEDGVQERSCSTRLLYLSACVAAYDVSVDEYEQMFEVTGWPHREIAEDEQDCDHMLQALDAIGPWAHFAVPVNTFEDVTGCTTWTLIPLS